MFSIAKRMYFLFRTVYRAPVGIQKIKFSIWVSDYRALGLSDLRTIGPSDCRTFGLSDRHRNYLPAFANMH